MAHQSSAMRAGPSAYTMIEEKEDAYGKTEAADTNPSDQQPPGVDDDYQSLEEALTGE